VTSASGAVDMREGVLQFQPSGRWAVCRPGHGPVEINCGDVFYIEVAGELKPTRMEFHHFSEGHMKGCTYRGLSGEYYSVDDYPLRNGRPASVE
jgi:hypothetical protein